MFEERESEEQITALEYLQSIYRDLSQAENRRMRAAIEALPFETPKLTAVATTELNGNSFGELLDRAIARVERSKQPPPPKMIDVTPVPHPASELKGPMVRLRRRV